MEVEFNKNLKLDSDEDSFESPEKAEPFTFKYEFNEDFLKT
jgi:hypothetical protein